VNRLSSFYPYEASLKSWVDGRYGNWPIAASYHYPAPPLRWLIDSPGGRTSGLIDNRYGEQEFLVDHRCLRIVKVLERLQQMTVNELDASRQHDVGLPERALRHSLRKDHGL
jgi:hypothetical protein